MYTCSNRTARIQEKLLVCGCLWGIVSDGRGQGNFTVNTCTGCFYLEKQSYATSKWGYIQKNASLGNSSLCKHHSALSYTNLAGIVYCCNCMCYAHWQRSRFGHSSTTTNTGVMCVLRCHQAIGFFQLCYNLETTHICSLSLIKMSSCST